MSGLAKCPACNRMGMIRTGAQQCTRCDRAQAEQKVQAPAAGQTFVIEAVEEAPDGTTEEVAPSAAEGEAIDAKLDQAEAAVEAVPPRRRRKPKTHVRAYGRVMFYRDEDQNDGET